MKTVSSILLVDDDVDDNEFHEIIIRESNLDCSIHTAGNGIQALDYLNKIASGDSLDVKPDLIFLDINMPRMSGLEFLEAYQKLPDQVKGAVVCILTTSINPTDRRQAENFKEVNEFCQKPLTPQMLNNIVGKYFTPGRYKE